MKLTILVPSLLFTSLVLASASAAELAAKPTKDDGFEWFVQAGAASGDGFAGLLMGLNMLLRRDSFAVGGLLEGSAGSAYRIAVAPTGGWSRRSESGWGVDLLGAIGVHVYDGVGRSLFLANDPGAGATLPFAGARGRVLHVFGKGTQHFQLGLSVAVDHDLVRATRSYSYRETSWFGGGPGTVDVTRVVGTTTVTGSIDLGMTFDGI